MSPAIPTVKITDPSRPGDFIIINESDFDPKKHSRWDDDLEAKRKEKKAAAEKGATKKGSTPATPPEPGETDTPPEGSQEAGAAGGPAALPEGLGDMPPQEVLALLPEGYTAEHKGGGLYFLFGPKGAAIPGPTNGKWSGADGALLAARDHSVHAADK